ncbi:hypothetical protein [Bythopirellula polymerisocia]|uniref:Uncharacterized protein n=1 Tax=Bythopirellula polymerisocia TaxID=2528003 RepID=A0A5C6CZA7_9BACT|nr:hypothetical protein [Bythopirellula polymerisocia]TWU30223.1 hypothetical protein Pla144_10090 [Bythopirellula polymerisocia]
MTENAKFVNWLLGLVGGVIGGVLGYFAFFLMVRQGLYAMVLPGALLGLGCGLLSGFHSNTLGVLCGVVAVLFGFFIEWQFAPFSSDDSFAYFITHVHSLKPMTLVMIAIGGLFGFWFGKGRAGGVWLRRGKK